MSNKSGRINRLTLGSILIVIAFNAFGGGYYGMTGARDVPLEWLQESPFKDYFFPGLILFTIVGGVCFASAVMVIKRHRLAKVMAYISGSILLSWIAAQVVIIGYVSWLQPAIVLCGLVILLLAARIAEMPESRHF